MNAFARLTRLTFLCTLLLLMVSSLGWFVFAPYQRYFAGYSLGLLISLLNGLIVAHKTKKIGDYATGKTKKMQNMGTLQRFLLAGFAGYIAIKYPELFYWLTVLIGVTTLTVLSFGVAYVLYLRKKWI